MKSLNARVAIYCDVEIKVDDDFDFNNYSTGKLINKAIENAPELSCTGDDVEYEVLSIWDEDLDKCLYAG